ncbi:hypothetical protein SSX86_015791 [Deinandra increscens subsp. villosa]|uniref:Receptor-like serine/threonine-protein kinase n=1 Tax=Deinandra increscens subsp. villosa TaxID=3103831 RepID=A0AAP0GXH2_9ASTR
MSFIASQLFLYFFIISPFSYGAADTLALNQSLSGNQTLASLDGNFEMGFFKPGKSPNYYIGIWYKGVQTTTIVWVANRETPIHNRFSSILKIIDGNLVLLNESTTQIWSTNMSSSSTATHGTSLVLLDDGNLVLRYGSSSSPPIWQSFDHPTHTWLPGSKLGYNKRTDTKQVLTSWRNSEDPGMGLFSLEIDQNSKQLLIKWKSSIEYWTSGSWGDQDKLFGLVSEMGMDYINNYNYVDNANESYFTYSSSISRLIIDVTGQIKQLLWSDTNEPWDLVWAQPRGLCQVYGRCGEFGVCSDQFGACNCLANFEPRLQSEWDLGSFSGGCVRKTVLDCSDMTQKPVFISSYIEKRFILAFPHNEALPLDRLECRSSCLDDCNCNAYTFMSKICHHWNLEFMNSDMLFSNYSNPDMIYIKVSSSDHHKIKIKIKIGEGEKIGFCLGSVAISMVFVLGLICLIIHKRNRILVGKTAMEGRLVAFAYRDLQIATKKFSDKLGGGGFGSVFKGILRDSSIVAVKKLESVSQGDKQFRSEVSTIGMIQHVNLVRLCGFCAQGNNKLLVYDYMPNGSLNSHLFHEKEDTSLSWEKRYQIALGIAKGLLYLHEKCRDCIIHCDIKPENILLDADFCPKIADFGLAKLMGRDFSRVLTTMRGTRGYLAPEWILGSAVTAKADVFSYGMMLFELVHGKRNSQQSEDLSFTFFPSLAAKVVMNGGDILSLIDDRLHREASVEEVTKVLKLAYWCIQDEEDNRPSMSQVEHALEGFLDVNMPPIPQAVMFFLDESDVESNKWVPGCGWTQGKVNMGSDSSQSKDGVTHFLSLNS